jgi:hypothetical protein
VCGGHDFLRVGVVGVHVRVSAAACRRNAFLVAVVHSQHVAVLGGPLHLAAVDQFVPDEVLECLHGSGISRQVPDDDAVEAGASRRTGAP